MRQIIEKRPSKDGQKKFLTSNGEFSKIKGLGFKCYKI